MKVIKKDGTKVQWDFNKIVTAITKSAKRAGIVIDDIKLEEFKESVELEIAAYIDSITVYELHSIIEKNLSIISDDIAKSYKDYRNYKTDFVDAWERIYKKSKNVLYLGDKENANFNSTLNSTKGSLIRGYLTYELYKKFELNQEELQAAEDGYVYIHDMRDLIFGGINCCLFDVKNVLRGGFEMSGIKYKEPKSILSALQVIGDIALVATAQQFGGWTIPEIDKILVPYFEKSIVAYKDEAFEWGITDADNYALSKAKKDLRQGLQSLEMKLNTVPCSRGDTAFSTLSFGNVNGSVDENYQRLICREILNVRMTGQGNGSPVVFPKLVYLHSAEQHKSNSQSRLFDVAIECSTKAMYPDYLSLDAGEVGRIFKETGAVVSPMGCVEGNEIITYKYKNKLYVESFKRFWDRIEKDQVVKNQFKTTDAHKYIDTTDITIYDSKSSKFVKVKRLIRNTTQDWVKVKVGGGRSLMCTPDHPFSTNRGRVSADGLLVKSDYVENVYSQYSEETIQFNDKKAWLLGMMLCDGCLGGTLVVSIHAYTEDDIEEEFHKEFKNHFGLNTRTIFKDVGPKEQYKDLTTSGCGNPIGTGSNLCNELIELFGGEQKIYRQIPNEVFSWNRSAKMSFLAGMIDADGYIAKDKSEKYCKVQFGSTNKELALQELALAQSLGLKATMYENHYTSIDRTKIRYGIEFYPSKELVDKLISKKKRDNFVEKTSKSKFEFKTGKINKVEHISKEEFSYDVTTESDYFDVSGIISHNCRAYLSEYKNEDGEVFFEGRANIGAVSLNLPMIWKKSDGANFFNDLDNYLEVIRQFLRKRYDKVANSKCSTNPLAFTQGGLYKGYKNPDDKVGYDIVKSFTASFGITALNELNVLKEGKQLHESDCAWVNEVIDYITNKVNEFKKADGYLYALYGTPAESLAGTQLQQFRTKFGSIDNVSDREYFTNSFHCHVSAEITPFQKQDNEYTLFHKINGGHIQYVRIEDRENKLAIKSIVKRGMQMGFYQGVNFDLCTCEDCGWHPSSKDIEICPHCSSHNITVIARTCGYLGIFRQNGDTRFNDSKFAEIQDRKSM